MTPEEIFVRDNTSTASDITPRPKNRYAKAADTFRELADTFAALADRADLADAADELYVSLSILPGYLGADPRNGALVDLLADALGLPAPVTRVADDGTWRESRTDYGPVYISVQDLVPASGTANPVRPPVPAQGRVQRARDESIHDDGRPCRFIAGACNLCGATPPVDARPKFLADGSPNPSAGCVLGGPRQP